MRCPPSSFRVVGPVIAALLLLGACSKSNDAATTAASSTTTAPSGTAVTPAAATSSSAETGTSMTTATTAPPSAPPTAGATTTTPPGNNSTGQGEGNAIRKVDFADFTFPGDACGNTFPHPPADGYPMHDGAAAHGTLADADFYSVTLHTDIGYGDVTGDGNDEAALILDCIAGNRPVPFGWVYTITDRGPSVLHAIALSPADTAALGGAGSLLDAKITNRTLVSRWAVFAAGDAQCCPSKQAHVTQRWTGSAFETVGAPTVS